MAPRSPPSSRQWQVGGADLERATGDVVPRSYFTNLRKGRIESPGYLKLRAIAKAMGFPPEVWFKEDLGGLGAPSAGPEVYGIVGRVGHLFDAVRNPKSGEPYTNAEVARMTLGDLCREDVEGIRTGAIPAPPVSQVAALAAAFGVPPSYLLERGKDSAVFDEEAFEALADETAGAILRESARLPQREKGIVLEIVRQFAGRPDDA